MHDIHWPDRFLPGATDNYVSNEVIRPGLDTRRVWPFLDTPGLWPDYYANASDIGFHADAGPRLSPGARFRFTTFGFAVEGLVVEHEAPTAQHPVARVAWHGWVVGDAEHRLDVHHAWLIEDLPGGRVRILTQETQIGAPARTLATTRPNPMLNAHQDWLEGLARAAAAAQPSP